MNDWQKEYPGEVIKETLWDNITANELSDYPANVADKIIAALVADGYVVVKQDDVRAVLRNGVDWDDDHGPTVRLADAVNATVR